LINTRCITTEHDIAGICIELNLLDVKVLPLMKVSVLLWYEQIYTHISFIAGVWITF